MRLLNKELIAKAQKFNLNKPATLINKTSDDTFDMYLYDVIGGEEYGGVSAAQIAAEMKTCPDGAMLNVRINSPGGDVFEGIAIYNLLTQRKGPCNVYVDGLAASIASVIAMAGKKVCMAAESEMMIHEAWSLAMGNAKDLRALADRLDASNANIQSIYNRKCGQPVGKIAEMMAAETWMSSYQAKELGFADEVIIPDKQKPVEAKKMKQLTPIELMRIRTRNKL